MLLDNSVEALRIQDVILGEAVVKNSVAGAQHGLGGLALSQSPGDANPRGKVRMVVNVILRLEAQPAADGQIGTRLPVVFHVRLDFNVIHPGEGVSRREGELACSTAIGLNLRKGQTRLQALFGYFIGIKGLESESAVEVGGGCGGLFVIADPGAKLQEMFG